MVSLTSTIIEWCSNKTIILTRAIRTHDPITKLEKVDI